MPRVHPLRRARRRRRSDGVTASAGLHAGATRPIVRRTHDDRRHYDFEDVFIAQVMNAQDDCLGHTMVAWGARLGDAPDFSLRRVPVIASELDELEKDVEPDGVLDEIEAEHRQPRRPRYSWPVETLFAELKRYVGWSAADEAELRALHPALQPRFSAIADVHYDRILTHDEAKKALVGGESTVGRLKVLLIAWMDRLLAGPWDEDYYQLRCRIGRVHVRISLPQHYMFGAMNVIRSELNHEIDQIYGSDAERIRRARDAVGKILDIELAIMLHTYREDLEAQQARKERLATFGQLIGSIGHELRNPLGVIESSMYVIGQRASDERIQKHVQRVGEQLTEANAIVTALLDMIRDRPLTRVQLSLPEKMEKVRATLSVPEGVRLVFEGLDGLPTIEGDATQMRQVFRNLLENALQAAAPAGEVRVRGRLDGDVVEISVEDTGPGLDPEVRRRLFEPLVTTKVKGIGLGLALVKRIVTRHGGDVAYVPRDGGGSCFVVRLPAAT